MRASRFVRACARRLRTSERNIEVWERLILTSFVVALVVHAAHAAHLLEGIEARWLDLMADVDRPRFHAPIAVVAITDADYNDPELFGGLSPLHPDGLVRLLERVLEHDPRGIVLDVQIHPAPHEPADRAQARLRLYRLLEEAAREGRVPIVVVRDARAEEADRDGEDAGEAAWRELTANPRLHWADPTIERGHGKARSVSYRVASGLPTVLGAAVAAFHLSPERSSCWRIARPPRPESTWRIRFTGHFIEDPARLTPHRTDARALLSLPVVPGQRSLLTDRIVLLGGAYEAGRDRQETAVGAMAGVYVWAEAIASWIRNDALCQPSAPVAIFLEFLLGVLAGLLLVRFGPALGLLYSLLIVAPLAVVASLLTFGSRVLFVNFLPSFVGVYLHYQVEIHWELRHLRRLHAPLGSLAPRENADEGETSETPESPGAGAASPVEPASRTEKPPPPAAPEAPEAPAAGTTKGPRPEDAPGL